MKEIVAIIGASKKPDRYSYKALQVLLANGHTPIPINPVIKDIEGVRCYSDLLSCPQLIDTITIYVRPSVLAAMVPDIIKRHPKRVIFNPGTEDEEIMASLEKEGIKVQEACTIVLLNTNQFEEPS
jgi:predicted CoA-binding protein